MITISVRAEIQAAMRNLSDLEKKQVPFATATMLTALARLAQTAEKQALPKVFDRPTPFTVNSVAVKGARKSSLEAKVFVKDIAAAYLAPFEFGGMHKLVGAGRTWLNPKDRGLLNQYGNFSKSALDRLKARPDVFVGTVHTRSGEAIGGVWQRPAPTKVIQTPGKRATKLRGANKTGHLKLLVRFGDAQPVKQHLEFGMRAESVVKANAGAEFAKALAKAVATAKRK